MTILVDQPKKYPPQMFRRRAQRHLNKQWCHMTSDMSEEELHEFAAKLGLKREWFQRNHYDIVFSKRQMAIVYGAEIVSSQEVVYSEEDRSRLLEIQAPKK